MNRDPDIYGADAHEFNPSRHLDSEGKIKAALVDTKEECHSKLLGFTP
jgi:cytochrome P450